MEKLKISVKKNWPFILIISFLSIFLLLNAIGTCTEKKSEGGIQGNNTSLNVQNVIDSVNYARDKEKIKEIDSLCSNYDKVILVNKQGTNKIKQDNLRLKIEKDSALARYTRLKTLNRCDSLVEAQNLQISGLEIEIDSVEAEAAHYSDLAYLFKQKSIIQETIIASKDSLITITNNTIVANEKLRIKKEKAGKFKLFLWKILAVSETTLLVIQSLK